MRLLVSFAVLAVACGANPGPKGPGPEPSDTSPAPSDTNPAPSDTNPAPSDTSPAPASDEATAQPASQEPSSAAGTPGSAPARTSQPVRTNPGGGDLPPQYDFDLLPRCKAPIQGTRKRKLEPDLRGLTQAALIEKHGLPQCLDHGHWRYELPAPSCPEWIDTLTLTLSKGRVKEQRVHRRVTGVTCR